MKPLVEYHLAVHALESPLYLSGRKRFNLAIESVLSGLLPYSRFLAAGKLCQRETVSEGSIESRVQNLLFTDLNPAAQIVGSLTLPQNATWAINAYTQSTAVGVRTHIELREEFGNFKLDMQRHLVASDEDPAPCSTSAFSIMQTIIGVVHQNTPYMQTPSLCSVARYLGVENSAAAEVARVCTIDNTLSIDRIVRQLGCHRRTLERTLFKDGLSLDMLRRAQRLLSATKRLRLHESLTTIAIEEGFSDLAHMSRAFRDATGVTPSFLRLAAHGGLCPEPTGSEKPQTPMDAHHKTHNCRVNSSTANYASIESAR